MDNLMFMVFALKDDISIVKACLYFPEN